MGDEVKRCWCDNGGVGYDNKPFQRVIAARGTTYEPGSPYARYTDDIAEHMIQTITENAL
jgi:hypothetical protein